MFPGFGEEQLKISGKLTQAHAIDLGAIVAWAARARRRIRRPSPSRPRLDLPTTEVAPWMSAVESKLDGVRQLSLLHITIYKHLCMSLRIALYVSVVLKLITSMFSNNSIADATFVCPSTLLHVCHHGAIEAMQFAASGEYLGRAAFVARQRDESTSYRMAMTALTRPNRRPAIDKSTELTSGHEARRGCGGWTTIIDEPAVLNAESCLCRYPCPPPRVHGEH
jgi:hypothetical protein